MKDAKLNATQLSTAYGTIVVDMRRMYHECNLVHGDLSEYNLLWHHGRAVIIDVSQSVEHAHPYASDFLRKDASNITEFFQKRHVRTLSTYELFTFITAPNLMGDDYVVNDDKAKVVSDLHMKLRETIHRSDMKKMKIEQSSVNGEARDEGETKRLIDEAVFLQSYIPTSLNEFLNPVAELNRIESGGREKVHEEAIKQMLGLTIQDKDSAYDEDENVDADDDDDDDDNDDDDNNDDSGEDVFVQSVADGKYHRTLPTHSDPEARQAEKDARKEARKIVKQAAAEKRKHKVPKHIKKSAVKKGSKNKK